MNPHLTVVDRIGAGLTAVIGATVGFLIYLPSTWDIHFALPRDSPCTPAPPSPPVLLYAYVAAFTVTAMAGSYVMVLGQRRRGSVPKTLSPGFVAIGAIAGAYLGGFAAMGTAPSWHHGWNVELTSACAAMIGGILGTIPVRPVQESHTIEPGRLVNLITLGVLLMWLALILLSTAMTWGRWSYCY